MNPTNTTPKQMMAMNNEVEKMKNSSISTANPHKKIMIMANSIKRLQVPIVPFPLRLHCLLDDAKVFGFSHIIDWNSQGDGFKLIDPKEFEKSVLPYYFDQTKYRSFTRQLNMYKFVRLTWGKQKSEYKHELFIRGRRELSALMKRQKNKSPSSVNFCQSIPLLHNQKTEVPQEEALHFKTEKSESSSMIMKPKQQCPEEEKSSISRAPFDSFHGGEPRLVEENEVQIIDPIPLNQMEWRCHPYGDEEEQVLGVLLSCSSIVSEEMGNFTASSGFDKGHNMSYDPLLGCLGQSSTSLQTQQNEYQLLLANSQIPKEMIDDIVEVFLFNE